MHNGCHDLGGLAGRLGFAEYLCESCLDLMAPSESHCQDHKKSDVLPPQALWGMIFISRCLWVVTPELTEGEPYLMNTGSPKKTNRFFEVNYVI